MSNSSSQTATFQRSRDLARRLIRFRGAARPTALLLGRGRSVLALARALKADGYRIIVGFDDRDEYLAHSRRVDGFWPHPPVQTEPDRFIAAVADFLSSSPEVELVVPASQMFMRAFILYGEGLPEGPTYVLPSSSSVLRCLDKLAVLSRADAIGVPTGPFAAATSPAELHAAVDQLGYPVLVQPQKTTERLNGRRAILCESNAELRYYLANWPQSSSAILLQGGARGMRRDVLFAASAGRLVSYGELCISRTACPDGTGTALAGVTGEPDPMIRSYVEGLARSLDYTGVGCVRLVTDPDSGAISLVDLTPGFDGNHAVGDAAGLMLTRRAVDLARGTAGDLPYLEAAPGRHFAWTAGELAAIREGRRIREIDRSEARRWLRDALVAALRAHVHLTWDWRDPWPAAAALARVVRRSVRRDRRAAVAHEPQSIFQRPMG